MALPPQGGSPLPKQTRLYPTTPSGPQNAGVPMPVSGSTLPKIPAAPAPAAAPAAPAPLDFNALTLSNPQYTTGEADLANSNTLALHAIQQALATNSQASQDNANAHGALFSGAAVHGQNYVAQQAADQTAQQTQNYLQSQHTLYNNVFSTLLGQLAPAGTIPATTPVS